jgi:Tol biopolymer transport system component
MVTAALAVLALGASGAWAKAKTKRISVKSNGDEVNTDNEFGAVSGDGRYVTFESPGKFTGHDKGMDFDIFMHDRKTGKTRRVSLKSNGKEAPGANCEQSAITPNARFVAFVCDGNLGGGDHNGMEDVYVRDLKKGKTTRVSVDSSGHGVPADSFNPAISANGRYIAFESDGALVGSDTNGVIDVYVRDLKKHKTRRASLADDGGQPMFDSLNPTISNDGNRVAFYTDDQHMTSDVDEPPDPQADLDVFVRFMKQHKTIRASLESNGTEPYFGAQHNQTPVLSANGRYVAFTADLFGTFVGGDINTDYDVYLKDLKTGKVSRVSLKSDGNGVLGSSGAGSERPLAISPTGRFVAFETTYPYTTSDINNKRDVYVRDRKTGKTRFVSVKSNGDPIMSLAGGQQLPAISADGHWVVFQTSDSLAPSDAGNDFDVFERGPLN